MPGALAAVAENEKDEIVSFFNGCCLMQAQIAAWLMFQGHLDLSAKVLEMAPPRFQRTEYKEKE